MARINLEALKAMLLECNRCRHQWLKRTRTVPRQCPACKSTYWNKPRTRKRKRNLRAARRS
jgi:hypothetical protein